MKLIFFSKTPCCSTADELIELGNEIGVDGFDLCVRKGHAVTPEEATKKLPLMVETLRKAGFEVPMVTGPAVLYDPSNTVARNLIAATGDCGIGLFKLCYFYPDQSPYWEQIERYRRRLHDFAEVGRRHQVKVCYHTHCDCIGHGTAALMHLLKDQDPEWLGAYLDTAHVRLAGEPWDLALQIVKEYLSIVAVKDVSYEIEGGRASNTRCFPPAPEGLVDWKSVVGELKKQAYTGPASVHAEFTKQFPSAPDFLRAAKRQVAFLREIISIS